MTNTQTTTNIQTAANQYLFEHLDRIREFIDKNMMIHAKLECEAFSLTLMDFDRKGYLSIDDHASFYGLYRIENEFISYGVERPTL